MEDVTRRRIYELLRSANDLIPNVMTQTLSVQNVPSIVASPGNKVDANLTIRKGQGVMNSCIWGGIDSPYEKYNAQCTYKLIQQGLVRMGSSKSSLLML